MMILSELSWTSPFVLLGLGSLLFNIMGLLLFIIFINSWVCRAQLPAVTIALHLMMLLFVLILILPLSDPGNVLIDDRLNCWFRNWQSHFLHAIFVGYNIKSFVLYYKLKVASFQAKLWSESHTSGGLTKGNSKVLMNSSSGHLEPLGAVLPEEQHESFTIKASNISLFICFMIIAPALLCLIESAFYDLFLECKAPYWLYMSLFLFSIDLLFQTWVSYKLLYLDDAFGIRFEIKWVTISTLLTLVPFLVAILL